MKRRKFLRLLVGTALAAAARPVFLFPASAEVIPRRRPFTTEDKDVLRVTGDVFLASGDVIRISGCYDVPKLNGYFTVTAVMSEEGVGIVPGTVKIHANAYRRVNQYETRHIFIEGETWKSKS
jgi:hypothetical protein